MKLVLLIGICIAFMVSVLSAGFEDKPHKY